jgi:hypothetical protein
VNIGQAAGAIALCNREIFRTADCRAISVLAMKNRSYYFRQGQQETGVAALVDPIKKWGR